MNPYYTTKKYGTRSAERIVFFFPAGFTKLWQYRWIIFLLNRSGVGVVGFDISWRKAIKECRFDEFMEIILGVSRSVNAYISENSSIERFSVLGISFGSVLALYCAKQNQLIQSIILFVPYGALSRLLWTYRLSQKFLERLEHEEMVDTEDSLHKLTRLVEPQYELEKLKDRQIISHSGKNDKIVRDGQQFINAVKNQKINATFYESRFGHFGTALFGLLKKKRWDKIL